MENQIQIINDYSAYKTCKVMFEGNHFKLLKPTAFVEEKDDGSLTYRSANDMKINQEHRQVLITENLKQKKVQFFEMWRKDPTLRLYNEVVFKPYPFKANANEYNLFKGFVSEQGKIVSIDEFHEYIETLSNGMDKSKRYLYAYLADIIQNPGLHNRSHSKCLILRGEQGCGKSTMAELCRALLGDRLVAQTANLDQLIQSGDNRFAEGTVGKVVAIWEEGTSTSGYSKADLLKNAITHTKTLVERKGIQGQEEYPNYTRFIVPTNHTNVIRVEPSDRRYLVLLGSSKHVGDKAFWNRFYTLLKNADFVHSIYAYLKNYDISKFDFEDRPITDAYKRCKQHNIPYVLRFSAEIAQKIDKKAKRYELDELFNLFVDFMNDNRFKAEITKPNFKAELNEYVDQKIGIYKVKNSTIKYYFEKQQLETYCNAKKFGLFDSEECEVAPEPAVFKIEDESKPTDQVNELLAEIERLKKIITKLQPSIPEFKITETDRIIAQMQVNDLPNQTDLKITYSTEEYTNIDNGPTETEMLCTLSLFD